MYSGIEIIKTVRHLENQLRYACNAEHLDHEEIEIGPEMTFGMGAASSRDFVASWVRQFEADQAVPRRGRKRTRLAIAEVIRVPYHAHVTDKEETFFLQKVNARMGGAAIMWRHRNRRTGATDWHIYRFKNWHQDENPLVLLRQASDDAHAELNEWRQQRNAPRIETMVEVRRRKKKENGITELAEQLLQSGKLTAANLQKAVEALGHTVTRFNPAKDTISVQHSSGKRAFRYTVSELLGRMTELRQEDITSGRATALTPLRTSPPEEEMDVEV